jgi:hypothetical protein
MKRPSLARSAARTGHALVGRRACGKSFSPSTRPASFPRSPSASGEPRDRRARGSGRQAERVGHDRGCFCFLFEGSGLLGLHAGDLSDAGGVT